MDTNSMMVFTIAGVLVTTTVTTIILVGLGKIGRNAGFFVDDALYALGFLGFAALAGISGDPMWVFGIHTAIAVINTLLALKHGMAFARELSQRKSVR